MDQNPCPGTWLLMVAAVAALLAVTPMSAAAEDYLPLTLGNYWVYDGSYFAQHERATIIGTILLWGTDVSVNRISESTFNEGLENYWTTSEDGDVSLWGFRWSDGYGVVYYPPGIMLDAPLYLGKQWSTTLRIYSTPDTTLLGEETWTLEVYTDETLVLPGGTFRSFGIGATWPSPRAHPSLEGRAPSGALLGPALRTPADWWSDGVGHVQYSTSDMYQLSAYGNEPTATQMTSWGRVKALYRP